MSISSWTPSENGWAIGFTNGQRPPYDFGWSTYPRSFRLTTSKLQCGCNNVTIYTYEPCGCNARISIYRPSSYICRRRCESQSPIAFYDRASCTCKCLQYCCRPGYVRQSAPPCRCVRAKQFWAATATAATQSVPATVAP